MNQDPLPALPDLTPTHLTDATTARPAHSDVATTAMPAHFATATTAQPAHAGVATTGVSIDGGVARTASTARQSSYAAGETLDLGRYQFTIDRLLFVGGQAELYLVRGGPDPVSVLKLYTHRARPKPEVLYRWRALPRNAVIALLDADPNCDPRAWELLAYAAGGPLAGASGAPPTPIRDAARLRSLTAQMAESLHLLHTVGDIVHRDVSPDNFLWLDTAQTRLVLSDLGSSSVMQDGSAKSGTVRGKLPFMAPEEVLPMGDGVHVGGAADFYSLGIVILTLWAGHHPFVGREADQIALKSRGATPMPADLPADLKELVDALLLPANIRIGYDDIQGWLRGQPLPRARVVRTAVYPRITVRPDSSAPYEVDTPAALAKFLRDEPAAGEKFLYRWNIREWAATDAGLMSDLSDVVEKDFPQDRAAGREKAIYLLDQTLPFVAPNGTVCHDYASLSEWVESGPGRPTGAIPWRHPLWSYLATRPEHELRDVVSELGADVRAGKPDASAIARLFLMQFASAGNWRDSDGALVPDLDTFTRRAMGRKSECLARLRDPADPMLLWLELQQPGSKERVGRYRGLGDAQRAALSDDNWLTSIFGRAELAIGRPLADFDACWDDALWPGLGPKEMISFLSGWMPIVHGVTLEAAILQWLELQPTDGARRTVLLTLITHDWQSLGRSLSDILAIGFEAMPAHTNDILDDAVVEFSRDAVVRRIDTIAAAAGSKSELAALEATTAFVLAASQARDAAPRWWDALIAMMDARIAVALRDAFTAYRSNPNVLAEIIGRRADLSRALTPFRAPLLQRVAAEDTRIGSLTNGLVNEEAKRRDGRVKYIGDEAIKLRGTTHHDTLSSLKQRQPATVRKTSRVALASFWGAAAFISPLFILGTNPELVQRSTQAPAPLTVAIGGAMALVFFLSVPVATWIIVRTYRGRGWAALAVIVACNFAFRSLDKNVGAYFSTTTRMAVGAAVAALLFAALFRRWKHVRAIRAESDAERDGVDPGLASSVTKSCRDAESLAREALSERFMMLHAEMALAKDPASVSLKNVPGGERAA